MLLERLVTRDGVPFEQAVELLRTNHQVEESRDALYEMSLGFLSARRDISWATRPLATLASDELPADERLLRSQRVGKASQVVRALQSALAALGAQDRLILKMQFEDGFQVSQIARLLAIEQKPLYARLTAREKGPAPGPRGPGASGAAMWTRWLVARRTRPGR